MKAKLKAACLEERLQKWKEHFNLLRNPPEVTGKPIKNIICLLDIKLGQFTEEELDERI